MAGARKHIRSSTADKRPTTAIEDGQLAVNTNAASPGLFFKDSTGATIIKVGPVHVGTTAPNAVPPTGGSSGNSSGEVWLDTSLTPPGVKIWDGNASVNATPAGSTTVQGLLELATNAETQAGADTARAVTPAALQSKVSDSTSTASSTTIASSAAVKSAYDLANAALPKSGGTVTGNLEIGTTGTLTFEGSTADGFETTLGVVDPTADRTITLPNTTGTVITTGDTGTVTSTMIADGAIVNADINASAAIAPSKLGSGALPSGVTVSSTNIVDGTIVNADVNASAAIAGSKISPNFAGQNVVTTGSITGASLIPSGATVPTNGVYLPAANTVGISANGAEKMRITGAGRFNFNTGASEPSDTVSGTQIHESGYIFCSVNGSTAGFFNRNTSDGSLVGFRRSNVTVGSISVTTTATAYNTSSDYRLKENIVPVTDGITRLQQLKPSRFNFIADPTKTVDGFLAHEVQTVVPEAITGEKDAVDADGNAQYQGIDQSKLVPLLTAALQEAVGEIESLKARVAALESA